MTQSSETVVQMVPHKGTTMTGYDYSDEEMHKHVCRVLGFSPQQMQMLRECMPDLLRFKQHCDAVERLRTGCRSLEQIVRRGCCPGNQLYSHITLDEYSDDTQTNIDVIVEDFGPGFVNTFPLSPNNAIRLEQGARPGFIPTKIAIDFNLANQGTNYSDLKVQFYLGPGGTVKGKAIGPEYRGNQFINKNGTQIHIDFPEYRGCAVTVGSVEKLAVEIRHVGTANNLVSAFVTIHYNNSDFYEQCKIEGC
ncbi:MAG: hypothetical protein H6713_42905 [Myxococcales bacterium]|nr:hypothetical protein [Myxococcales bacterium]